MTYDEHAHPARRAPVESLGVLEDDLLVEAARSGWLRGGDPDPLTRLLALLHHCPAGTCPCPSRDECGARALHPLTGVRASTLRCGADDAGAVRGSAAAHDDAGLP